MARRNRRREIENVGIRETLRRLREIGTHVESAAKRALKESVDMVVADIKERCPVRTGKLRDSIKAEANSDGTVYKIIASAENEGVDYSRLVEYSPRGTPFMQPALEANKDRVYDNIRAAARRAFETGHD